MLSWAELISRDTNKASLNLVLIIGTHGDIGNFKEHTGGELTRGLSCKMNYMATCPPTPGLKPRHAMGQDHATAATGL